MHCVDLGESFPTSIYLQKSAERTCLLACVDTAENEPLEVWVKIIQYCSFVSLAASRSRQMCSKVRAVRRNWISGAAEREGTTWLSGV